MPAVFRQNGLRFHFYASEGNPREPVHVHVAKDGADAKLWLYPSVAFAYNRGFDAPTQGLLIEIVEARRTEIENAWNEFFA